MQPDELPAPLTPPECDLRDFPFMQLDVLRLRDSDIAAVEDPEAFRAAVLAWCAAWHQVPAASLPNDEASLCRLLGYGRDMKTFRRARDGGALRGFVLCSDNRLYHRVVAEKANEAWSQKERQRERGRRGNAARWGSRKDASAIAEGSPEDRTRIADASRDASPEDRKGEERRGEEKRGEERNPLTPSASEGGQTRSSIGGRKGLRANGTSPRQIAAAAEAAKPPPPEPDSPLWPLLKARGMTPAEFRVFLATADVKPDDHRVVIASSFSRSRIKAEHGAALEAAGWRIEAVA